VPFSEIETSVGKFKVVAKIFCDAVKDPLPPLFDGNGRPDSVFDTLARISGRFIGLLFFILCDAYCLFVLAMAAEEAKLLE
jgi:hypothetical protein